MRWVESTRCDTGQCVEVARESGAVLLRDSKDPGGAVLALDPRAWAVFIAGVRAGEFDA